MGQTLWTAASTVIERAGEDAKQTDERADIFLLIIVSTVPEDLPLGEGRSAAIVNTDMMMTGRSEPPRTASMRKINNVAVSTESGEVFFTLTEGVLTFTSTEEMCYPLIINASLGGVIIGQHWCGSGQQNPVGFVSSFYCSLFNVWESGKWKSAKSLLGLAHFEHGKWRKLIY